MFFNVISNCVVHELKIHIDEILIRWPSEYIGSTDDHLLHSYDGLKRHEIHLEFGNYCSLISHRNWKRT